MSFSCLKCFIDGCVNCPILLCRCKDPAAFFCEEHFTPHILDELRLEHHSERISIEMKSVELRKILTAKINKIRNRKSEFISNLHSFKLYLFVL
ncbi:unnamed protein product [Blepharisma stoltei]|uniref:Uncharacterized protein n=1 Tax=Blepharisma stoltei TaxID=1481888 RepID=A0AAU9J4H2_9CILI|nr:unnamed protein product [Blepharisma stoltei]